MSTQARFAQQLAASALACRDMFSTEGAIRRLRPRVMGRSEIMADDRAVAEKSALDANFSFSSEAALPAAPSAVSPGPLETGGLSLAIEQAEMAMKMPAAAATAVEAARERLTPALDKFDETVREGRRAIARGQEVAEDAAAAALLHIRRRPLRSVLVAAGVGALAGGLIGIACGWLTQRERSL